MTDEEREQFIIQRMVTLAKHRADLEAARAGIIDCENDIGEAMGTYKTRVGSQEIRRHRRKPRTREWDSDGLLRMVEDSRAVDPKTGEIIDETPTERLKAVFGLKGYQAKLSELERRGIQYDEWCQTEDVPGFSLEIR